MTRDLRSVYTEFEKNQTSASGVNFFKLKDDREKAFVRFLHAGESDLDWYITHEVMLGGRKTYIRCLEGAHCPGCQANNRAQLKLFLQLIQQGDQQGVIRVWERGQKFIPKILSFLERNQTLCGQVVEVERLGRNGDTNTDYNLYASQPDGMTPDRLPQRIQICGPEGHVQEKSIEEMQRIFASQGRVAGTARNEAPQYNTQPPYHNPGGSFGQPPYAPPQPQYAPPQPQYMAPQSQFAPPPQSQFAPPPPQAPYGQQPTAFNAPTTPPPPPQPQYAPPQPQYENGLPFDNVTPTQQPAPQQQPPAQQQPPQQQPSANDDGVNIF